MSPPLTIHWSRLLCSKPSQTSLGFIWGHGIGAVGIRSRIKLIKLTQFQGKSLLGKQQRGYITVKHAVVLKFYMKLVY